jgi:uncharacterized protein (DUF2336 family)
VNAAALGHYDTEPAGGDLAARVRLGANPATPSEVLSMLARDPAVTVRAAVALNEAASPGADQHLAIDADERVRMLLARKMLSLVPKMSLADQTRLREQTTAVLSMLVQDEAVRIRVLVADVLAELPGVPRTLIMALARDEAVPVSEPVLRLSPLLSPADLLALLNAPPHPAATSAIACRPNLPETVADAIAASADNAAIRALLANPSAAIRESTLDALIARAHQQPDWQEPLVRRPVLPEHAARALSEIVASHLLQVLVDRTDLQPGLAAELKQRLWARLVREGQVDGASTDEAMMLVVRRLEARGKLDEATLMETVRAGDARLAAGLLAVAAGVKLQMVDRAATLRSAKALVSLVWKAGFSMRVAGPVQSLLGHIAPSHILVAVGDEFPLGPDEMCWQLDLLGRDGR